MGGKGCFRGEAVLKHGGGVGEEFVVAYGSEEGRRVTL